MQRNITNVFNTMELFNYLTVFAEPFKPGESTKDLRLDDQTLETFRGFRGVETVFPDIRFPAEIGFKDRKEFSFVQVLPAQLIDTKLINLRTGGVYDDKDTGSLIISDSFLRRLGVKDFTGVLGGKIRISTLVFDFSGFSLLDLTGFLSGERQRFTRVPG